MEKEEEEEEDAGLPPSLSTCWYMMLSTKYTVHEKKRRFLKLSNDY